MKFRSRYLHTCTYTRCLAARQQVRNSNNTQSLIPSDSRPSNIRVAASAHVRTSNIFVHMCSTTGTRVCTSQYPRTSYSLVCSCPCVPVPLAQVVLAVENHGTTPPVDDFRDCFSWQQGKRRSEMPCDASTKMCRLPVCLIPLAVRGCSRPKNGA